MAAPLYPCIQGKIVVSGYAPDGDSVRFVPADPRQLGLLSRSSLIVRGFAPDTPGESSLSTLRSESCGWGCAPHTLAALAPALRQGKPGDGSVQIRLEGIDAPEVHYTQLGQPLGAIARDALLAWLGFSKIAFAKDGETIASSTPASVPAAILARSVDTHGRPIAYVLRDHRVHGKPRCHHVNAALLAQTANHAMIEGGFAYLLAYSSLPREHRRALRELAHVARAHKRGVWAHDSTTRGFELHGRRSIGPHGALVFPKLFRRCVSFLADRARGFRASLVEWLGANERVLLPHAANVPFRSIVHERGNHVALAHDLLDLVFVEQ